MSKDKSNYNNNMRRSLLFACTIMVSVVAIVTVAVFAIKNSANVVNNNQEYLKDTAKQTSGQIYDAIEGGKTNIKWISSVAQETLTSPKVEVERFQNVLDNSMFDSIEFVDANGFAHNISGSVFDVSDRDCYKRAMNDEEGIELILDSDMFGETVLLFYAPLHYDGKTVGSLVGIYKASKRIIKLLDQKLFDEQVESFLCMKDGTVIANNKGIDTTEGVLITDIMRERLLADGDADDFIFNGSMNVVPLERNETGACVCGIDNSDWYLVQVFPQEINGQTIHKANSMGIGASTFLILIVTTLLLIIYVSMNKQRREMSRLLEQTQEFSRAKTTFLFNMSHDIRTPMNAIVGFTAMAKKRVANPEKIKDYLDKIETAGGQLLALINQVLEMSRIESGKVVLEKKCVNIKEREKVILIIYGDQARSKDIRFTASLKNVKHDNVWADADRLEQIINNIIGNALKYTNPGGTVRYEIEEKESNVPEQSIYRFTVTDTGIGMSRDFQDHIFEEFSRENTSTVSKIQGTGLGMSIVKQLAELMNGTIDIKSQSGVGTTISVEIPLKWCLDPTLLIDQKKNDVKVNLTGMKVLLVEDNEMNREIAEEILKERGIEVFTAEDGDVAVEMVGNSKPGDYELILMDVQMPRMNGYDATRAIRKLSDRRLADIPIVAMTANAFEEDRRDALEAGMNDHLSKPIDINALISIIAGFRKE